MFKFLLLFFWIPTLLLFYLLKAISRFFFRRSYGNFLPDLFRFYAVKIGIKAVLLAEDLFNYILQEDHSMGKIFGLRPDEVREYVLKEQVKDPEEDQIKWLVKPLQVRDSAEITDMVYTARGFGKKREEAIKSGTQQLAILERGLKGWQNFTYEDGKEVPWEAVEGNKNQKAQIMERNLNRVPVNVRDELADEIRGTSELDSD